MWLMLKPVFVVCATYNCEHKTVGKRVQHSQRQVHCIANWCDSLSLYEYVINLDQINTCHSKGCLNTHINTQWSPLWRHRRHVFSHANSHKGGEYHLAIGCPKHLAPDVAIRSFERGRSVGLRDAWQTYWRIAAHVGHNVSVACRCFQQWSVGHFQTRRPGSGRPCNTDARQVRLLVRAPVAASREDRVHVAPAVSLRAVVNRLLVAGLRLRVPLARHGYSVVEKGSTGKWNGPTSSFMVWRP